MTDVEPLPPPDPAPPESPRAPIFELSRYITIAIAVVLAGTFLCLPLPHTTSSRIATLRDRLRRDGLGAVRALVPSLLCVVACHATSSNDSALLRAQIDSLLAGQRVDEALALVDERIARDPARADAWRERTRCLVLQSNFDPALVAVERAIDLAPRDAWSHYERGYLLRQMGRDDDAIASFTRAIEIDPRHFKAYEHRGGAHLEWERYEEARADFTRAIDCWTPRDPGVAEAYSFRARALMSLGRNEEAERDVETAARIRSGSE